MKSSDVIVVCGGDGFMLKTIKKHYRFKKPFYGINCGLVGFLMNKYVSENLKEKVLILAHFTRIIQVRKNHLLYQEIPNQKGTYQKITRI